MTYAGREVQASGGGNGISGHVLMDNREYRKCAFRVWKADCLDMESTAIAQVCWANRKPFLIVRSLSDKRTAGRWESTQENCAVLPARLALP